MASPKNTQEFLTGWKTNKIFALPFKPAVASMFCLFSEGLGYAFLYHLAQVTTDPEIRAMLEQNVVDEEVHIRLSISVLKQALEQNDRFIAAFLIYLSGYSLIARK